MKEFVLKYKVAIIVTVLVVLFLGLSLLMDSNSGIKMKDNMDTWVNDTKKDEYTITVIAQLGCGNCTIFKPILQKVIDDYDFENVYWFEVDDNNFKNHSDYYTTLTSTYDLTEYSGTPYTFITKNGEFIDYISGRTTEDVVVEFLKKNNVIK